MNSCLYECRLGHYRLKPKPYRFGFRHFMFYLDLDELPTLDQKLRLFKRNRAGLFSFFDADHLREKQGDVRKNLTAYLKRNGVELGYGKVWLLTHTRMFGYVFNPVSFYFCFDERGEPLCAVPEVNNTFGEMKPFLLDRTTWKAGSFRQRIPKLFYVSPFMNLDVRFEFDLSIPQDTVSIQIEDFDAEERIFRASLHGVRRPLTDPRLAWYTLKYPCLTLRIVLAIHWHALRLVLRRVPFHRKAVNPEMQQGLYAPISRTAVKS
ncbi:MAG: DUF1365 domain-containing protein [Acidimicrobiia bacterium]|nr:DUF1365 domain-containing protein [Acidimicrobiia bacterium]